VLRQQPGNRLLWLFLAVGLGMGLFLAGTDLAEVLARNDRPGGRLAEWVGVGFGELAWPLLWLTIQLFPTGRPLPGRFWRFVVWFSLFWYAMNFIEVLFTADVHRTYRSGNPYASDFVTNLFDTLFRPLDQVTGTIGTSPVFLLILVLGLVSFGLRYRRGSGVERAQLRALGVGLAVVIVSIPLVGLAPAGWRPALLAAAFLLLPASFGFAILRHGLYELDALVSRTATYGLLTGSLLGVYLGLVALTTHVLDFGSSLSAALATLVAAALFQPLRHLLQRAVDRRFNRSRYDALAQVEDFAVRLRTPLDTEAITGDLVSVVTRTVQPASVSVWLTRG
jgi:hypothetical protein